VDNSVGKFPRAAKFPYFIAVLINCLFFRQLIKPMKKHQKNTTPHQTFGLIGVFVTLSSPHCDQCKTYMRPAFSMVAGPTANLTQTEFCDPSLQKSKQ
jgi:hypothetical protein